MTLRILSWSALRLVNMPVCKKDRQNIADEDRAQDNAQSGFIEPFNIVRAELQ